MVVAGRGPSEREYRMLGKTKVSGSMFRKEMKKRRGYTEDYRK